MPDAIAGVVHSMPALDTQWIETTSKKAAMKLEKLDMDLKNYKSNSIKESIRYEQREPEYSMHVLVYLLFFKIIFRFKK